MNENDVLFQKVSMPVSLSGVIHHSHSFTGLEIYHHIYFIKKFVYVIACGRVELRINFHTYFQSFRKATRAICENFENTSKNGRHV